MHRTTQVLLWTSCILIGIGANDVAQSRNRGVGVSVGGKNGINANVDASTKNGVDADVSASVGGRKGVNANVDADTGRNVDANVDASIGGTKGVTANVDANTGKGVNADVDASVGGVNGLNTNADVSLGNPGVGANLGVDVGGVDTNPSTTTAVNPDLPGVTGKNPKQNQTGTLTAAQLQAFNAMSDSEKKAMLKRCLSVGAGGYDPALVNLCKLLRMSASR